MALMLAVIAVIFGLDLNALFLALKPALELVLPGLITAIVAGLWKTWFSKMPTRYITLLVVPVVGAIQAIIAGLALDANVWTGFLLSLVATFFFEFKKQAATPPAP